MKPRYVEKIRKTKETAIELKLCLDGSGESKIQTGIPFFNHMLDLFTKHSSFNIDLQVDGDIEVDFHHTVEDVGITLGEAIFEALGDKKSIMRFASGLIPMDEALCQIAVDISNRPFLNIEVDLAKTKVGNFDIELVEDFLQALTNNARITLHVKQLSGRNLHHILESVFKGVGYILKQAVKIDPETKGIPSTKGIL